MGFRKMAGVAGIGFVVLTIGSFVAYGSPPTADASAEAIAEYVAGTDGYLLAGLMGVLAAVLLLPFLAGFTIPFFVSDRTHNEGYGVLIAGTTLVASATMGTALAALTTVGLRIEQFDPTTVRALWDFSNVAYGFSILLLIPAAGGTALASLKHGLTPRWFANLSGVVGLLGFSGIPAFVATSDLALAMMLGFVGMLIWILAASILMVREGSA